jgi:hypothetical protein
MMNEENELTERERGLLEEIEQILANERGERREADSLYGFCAHLASTVPRADDDFRQRLESRLVARLQQQVSMGEARPPWFQRLALAVGRIRQALQPKGGMTLKWGLAFAALAVLVITVSTVAFVPSVRAQVGEILNTWFHFKSPGGGWEVALSGPAKFTPLQPTYLPDTVLSGLVSTVGSVTTGAEDEVGLFFGNPDDQWLYITQRPALAERALPEGQRVQVNGREAVLLTGQSGVLVGPPRPLEEILGEKLALPPGCLEAMAAESEPGKEPAPLPPECQQAIEEAGGIAIINDATYRTRPIGPPEMEYENAMRLIWYVGAVKVDILSNLPEEEMLKVAESMVPVEAGEGESPFGPPLDPPLR